MKSTTTLPETRALPPRQDVHANEEAVSAAEKVLRGRRRRDRLFSIGGGISIAVMTFFLLLLVIPILRYGAGAYVYRGTIEDRRVQLELFERGNAERLAQEWAQVSAARAPIYKAFQDFEAELSTRSGAQRRTLRKEGKKLHELVSGLLGVFPDEPIPTLLRDRYGKTRWDQAQQQLERILIMETWDYSGEEAVLVRSPRRDVFAGTALEPVFDLLETDPESLLLPRWTFYPQFLTDASMDAHFFGGIGPEVRGTIFLMLGAMLLAIPFGIIAAVYFQEYAGGTWVTSLLRSCVNTLSGVPSVVFGLFGLAFFINTMHVSPGKSVAAGALTLALLVLPLVIRASEEAIAAVPHTYKEAALALGAGRWRTVLTVILPAAMPGILTGIVISMGRAAGETAPIIFTAAVSVGRAVRLGDIFTEATPALSWNLYNLCTEHQSIHEVVHVQYGMALTLVALVLLFNLAAIILRARVARRLKG